MMKKEKNKEKNKINKTKKLFKFSLKNVLDKLFKFKNFGKPIHIY